MTRDPRYVVKEIRQQRWLFGIVAIGGVIVGALEFRHIPSSDRLFGVVPLASGAVLGFAVMFARERYLRKSGKIPRDKPPPGVMLWLIISAVGLAGFMVLLDPLLRVLVYGFFVGLMLGLFVYIGADIRRLRGG